MSQDLVECDANDADEFDEKILSQALPVANLGKNVDLNVPPSSGEEYLYRVRIEASKNKVVVAENINLKKFEKNRTAQYFQTEKQDESREEFKAPLEWQYQVSAELSELRDRVRREKKDFLKNQPKTKVEFPPLKNKNEWFAFFFGNSETESSGNVEGHEPCLGVLYRMDQNTIVNLLDYHVGWIEKYGYSKISFEWVYGLFCFLEKPLLPETHSSMRTLARTCIEMRLKLADVKDERLAPLNLLISLIGRYFEQTDLADS